jgi:hypothetical protein
VSRESFLQQAAAFDEGVPVEPGRAKKYCVIANFEVVCDLPQCSRKCQFEDKEDTTRIRELEAEKAWLAKRSDDLQTESNGWKKRAEKAEAERDANAIICERQFRELASIEAMAIERCETIATKWANDTGALVAERIAEDIGALSPTNGNLRDGMIKVKAERDAARREYSALVENTRAMRNEAYEQGKSEGEAAAIERCIEEYRKWNGCSPLSFPDVLRALKPSADL